MRSATALLALYLFIGVGGFLVVGETPPRGTTAAQIECPVTPKYGVGCPDRLNSRANAGIARQS